MYNWYLARYFPPELLVATSQAADDFQPLSNFSGRPQGSSPGKSQSLTLEEVEKRMMSSAPPKKKNEPLQPEPAADLQDMTNDLRSMLGIGGSER
jgi:hypothetical protein